MATHVEDSVDPVRDLEIIRDELRLKARRRGMQREDAERGCRERMQSIAKRCRAMQSDVERCRAMMQRGDAER